METENSLYLALKAAYARAASEASKRFPAQSEWEPPAERLGTDKAFSDQELEGWVPTVPTVPTEKHKRQHRTRAEALAEWQERAAILEFEGGLSRAEAEAQATAELGEPPAEA